MTTSLSNKRILVTRPKELATSLCELISNSGGEAISFPTIEIKPIANSKAGLTHFNNINAYDSVIFVSRNAVKLAFDFYLPNKSQLEKANVFAIGAGTAEELRQRGILDVSHAGKEADTEALLDKSGLQAENIQGKKLLIVRGVGGRELLAKTLSERGAKLDYTELYQRAMPQYEANEIKKIWQNGILDVIITTSGDGLKNLITLTIDEDRKTLFKTPLVVMSKRVCSLAKEKGFISRIEVATEKNDKGLFAAALSVLGE